MLQHKNPDLLVSTTKQSHHKQYETHDYITNSDPNILKLKLSQLLGCFTMFYPLIQKEHRDSDWTWNHLVPESPCFKKPSAVLAR